MKYQIKEIELEKLQQKSKERHKDDTDRMYKSGSLDLNGKNVEYSLFVKRNSIFANTKIVGNKFRIFIMNELDFIPMDQKEQKKISEYRIKKFLEKKLAIKESIIPKVIRRRFNEDTLQTFVNDQLKGESTPCDDFGDEFEFADNVLSNALDEFLVDDESIIDEISDDYDEIHSHLMDYVKEWFGTDLFEIYLNSCDETLNEQTKGTDRMVQKMSAIISNVVKDDEWLCDYEIEFEESSQSYFITVYTSKSFDEQTRTQRIFWRTEFEKVVQNKLYQYLSTVVSIGFVSGDC